MLIKFYWKGGSHSRRWVLLQTQLLVTLIPKPQCLRSNFCQKNQCECIHPIHPKPICQCRHSLKRCCLLSLVSTPLQIKTLENNPAGDYMFFIFLMFWFASCSFKLQCPWYYKLLHLATSGAFTAFMSRCCCCTCWLCRLVGQITEPNYNNFMSFSKYWYEHISLYLRYMQDQDFIKFSKIISRLVMTLNKYWHITEFVLASYCRLQFSCRNISAKCCCEVM